MRISETGWSSTPPVGPHGTRSPADATRVSGGADSLELSQTAQAFRAWVQSARHTDTATQNRIEELRRKVTGHTYRPPAEHIAAQLLTEARAQRSGGKGHVRG